MTKLEQRVRSGLHETAVRISETTVERLGQPKSRRPDGVWMGVAAVLAVLVLFGPVLLLADRMLEGSAEQAVAPTVAEGVTPAEVGFEFANPEHVSLRFSQTLTLTCHGLETVDNGGFDSFNIDIWIDHQAGYTRLEFEYPDGSTHALILEGRPGAWEQAWGSGTDRGRDAGCRETRDDGGYEQSIAGWGYQDSSELWFTAYLKPVNPVEDDGVEIYHERRPTQATPAGRSQYVIEEGVPGRSEIRSEYMLDEPQVRVVGEHRYTSVSGQFEAEATIEVLESGPTTLPPGIFDTSDFTPLWGSNPVPTTEATTP